MKDFIINNAEILGTITVFLLAYFLPNPKIFSVGKKVGEKIPKKLREELADKIDSFEQGLRGQNVDGDGSLTSNEQINEGVSKLKVDLGLEESNLKNKV